jgi:hypothetical protein
MLNLINIRTSGAYVLYKGLFIFQVGPTKNGDKLGVVRLGGHSESNETALDTAKREVFEEAYINIIPINSATTFYLKDWKENASKVTVNDIISPILIKGSEETSYSVMYLSYSDTKPEPSSETHGLLLLSPNDVDLICQNKLTLNDYIKLNGISILKSNLDRDLILEPFPQLLFLSKLLKEEPELMNNFVNQSLSN